MSCKIDSFPLVMFRKTYLLLFFAVVGELLLGGVGETVESLTPPLPTTHRYRRDFQLLNQLMETSDWSSVHDQVTDCHFCPQVTKGFPAPDPAKLPSMLNINSEEELGLYSKKWNLTPVQMCTLMGHQMTVAQPLLDINHPLVAHLPSIGEMAMSDAVMICEKVLNDAKGRTATITTVVEETRQEYAVPRDFLFDEEDFKDITDGLMDSVGFSSDDMISAMHDNSDALAELLGEQMSEDEMKVEVEGMIPKTEGNVFLEKGEHQHHQTADREAPPTPPKPTEPSIADRLRGQMYSD